MQKRTSSLLINTLSLILILIGAITFINHKKDRELIALDESKSKLTNQDISIEKLKVSANTPIEESPLINRERLFTELEIKEMNQTQFESLLDETTSKLPKLSDIKTIPPEALHSTPAIVIQAGRDLGLIKEILSEHPDFNLTAVKFYKKCVKDEEGVTPVRALCLTNILSIQKENGIKTNLNDYPKQLVDLAKVVTDI